MQAVKTQIRCHITHLFAKATSMEHQALMDYS